MEYFEEFADLIETEDEINFEDVYEAIKGSLSEDMGEILENYMNELQIAIPDEEQELYMLVENMKTSMLFLCENLEDESTMNQFCEEVFRFKQWYTETGISLVNGVETTVMDAVATARANKITGDVSRFDFSGALDYEIKDFSFSIGQFQPIDILDESSESDSIN